MRALRATLVLAVAAALLVPGCVDPRRIQVDGRALAAAPVRWDVKAGSEETHGLFGPNKVDTTYTFDPAGTNPPYPAQLIVVGVRAWGGYTAQDLLALAQDGAAGGAKAKGVKVDPSKDVQGQRVLASGVHTLWFTREGTVTGAPPQATGAIFPQGSTVRLFGEAGFDGLSSTGFYSVAYAQVASNASCPPILTCTPAKDVRTWNNIVADPVGSVGGAIDKQGLAYSLVTHG